MRRPPWLWRGRTWGVRSRPDAAPCWLDWGLPFQRASEGSACNYVLCYLGGLAARSHRWVCDLTSTWCSVCGLVLWTPPHPVFASFLCVWALSLPLDSISIFCWGCVLQIDFAQPYWGASMSTGGCGVHTATLPLRVPNKNPGPGQGWCATVLTMSLSDSSMLCTGQGGRYLQQRGTP